MTEKSKRKRRKRSNSKQWQQRLNWVTILYMLSLLPTISDFTVLVGVVTSAAIGLVSLLYGSSTILKRTGERRRQRKVLIVNTSDFILLFILSIFVWMCFIIPVWMGKEILLGALQSRLVEANTIAIADIAITGITGLITALLVFFLLMGLSGAATVFSPREDKRKPKLKSDYQDLAKNDEANRDDISLQHLAENEAEQNEDLR